MQRLEKSVVGQLQHFNTNNRKGGQALAVVAFYGGYVLPKLLKLSKFFFLVGNLRNLGSLGIVFNSRVFRATLPTHHVPPYSVGRVFTPCPRLCIKPDKSRRPTLKKSK